jgi:hypothetical protein
MVVAEHIDALNNCDADRLMAQYPETIEILLPGGATVAGRDDVRGLFEGFCLPYPDGLNGLTFTEISSGTVHKTLNVQWSAEACFLAEPYLGTDAYETWSGLMAAQVTTFDGAELVENPNWEVDFATPWRRQTSNRPAAVIGRSVLPWRTLLPLVPEAPPTHIGTYALPACDGRTAHVAGCGYRSLVPGPASACCGLVLRLRMELPVVHTRRHRRQRS